MSFKAFSKIALPSLIGKTMYRHTNEPCKVIRIVDELKGLVEIEYETIKNKHGEETKTIVTAEENLVFLTENPRPKESSSNRPDWFDTVQGLNNPISSQLSYLFRDYLNGKVNLDPEYQRGFVWSVKQQSEYLQAVLDEKVEPVLYACLEMDDEGDDVLEILDGKQRLTTLFNFLIGKISLPNGKFFHELSPKDASFFRHLHLSVYRLTINRFTRNLTNKEKLEIFLMINEKGTRLTETDLEHAKEVLSK